MDCVFFLSRCFRFVLWLPGSQQTKNPPGKNPSSILEPGPREYQIQVFGVNTFLKLFREVGWVWGIWGRSLWGLNPAVIGRALFSACILECGGLRRFRKACFQIEIIVFRLPFYQFYRMPEQVTPWPHAPTHQLSENGTYFVPVGTYLKAHHFCTPQRLDVLQRGLLKPPHTIPPGSLRLGRSSQITTTLLLIPRVIRATQVPYPKCWASFIHGRPVGSIKWINHQRAKCGTTTGTQSSLTKSRTSLD
jgi:hypothetical protein